MMKPIDDRKKIVYAIFFYKKIGINAEQSTCFRKDAYD